jgi:hypothetical protein
MPKLGWQAFREAYPTSHCVRLVLAKDQEGSPLVPLREVQQTIARLLAALGPAGYYSLTIRRDAGEPEILCLFSEEKDADLLAEAVPGYPPEISGRSHPRILGDEEYGQLLERAGRPRSSSRKPRHRMPWSAES